MNSNKNVQNSRISSFGASLSPRQVAKALGVSESSVKRWCDQELLPTVRTAGGHRRLLISDVLQYVRQNQLPLVHPQLLGLPATVRPGQRALSRAVDPFAAALIHGDLDLARRIVFDLYLAGEKLVVLFDSLFAPVFQNIGQLWECKSVDVYQERRACELSRRLIEELRFSIAKPATTAPLAVGGTPEGDPYQLATTMAELALQEAGWNALSLGASLPFDSLTAALLRLEPRLFWLSVSHVPDREEFVRGHQRLYQAARTAGVPVIVGGNVLDPELRRLISFTSYGDTLQHLVEFASSLWSQGAASAGGQATKNSDLPT